MEFILMDLSQKATYKDEMLKMLCYSDKEFVPPLSARSSTTQKDLSGSVMVENGLESYFSEMCNQQIMGVFEDDTLLSFISFRENYTSDVIGEQYLPNIYLSTLVSKPETRGRGITVKLYDHLFNHCYADRFVLTRTWSTNFAHTRILEKFAFGELLRIADDRGKGIDTVYYVKKAV